MAKSEKAVGKNKPAKKAKKDSKKLSKKAKKEQGHKLVLRPLHATDYPSFKRAMDAAYPTLGGAWVEEQFLSQIKRFPEGQLCIEDKGEVIAAAVSVIVQYDQYGDNHSYKEITGNGYLTTHDPNGDTLYGVDIFVHPDYRDIRLGRRLYEARKDLCVRLNLKRFVAGGRIPSYAEHAAEMTTAQYIQQVVNKELHDPVLSFQLANGFHVRHLIRNYEPKDRESGRAATLLEWINTQYTENPETLVRRRKEVRVGAVQWQMRPAPTFATTWSSRSCLG